MKRFRFRKLICASAVGMTLGAATLGTSVFTEAAGPVEFVSGLWDKRPKLKKLSETRLNPRQWVSRFDGGSSTDEAMSSTRPGLYEDPFAQGDTDSPTDGNSTPTVARHSPPHAAPSPGQRREATRNQISASSGNQMTANDRLKVPESGGPFGKRQIVRHAPNPKPEAEPTGDLAPMLPDGLSVSKTHHTPILPHAEGEGPVSTILQPEASNQFSPGFDKEFQRIVQSVINETDPVRLKAASKTTTQVVAGGRDTLRGSVKAPELPGSLSNGQSPLAGGTEAVGELIERSRRDMETGLAIPVASQESPLITSRPGQQRVSLTEATEETTLHLRDGHPAMVVPSMQSPGGSVSTDSATVRRDSADLRQGWTGDRSTLRHTDRVTPGIPSGPIRPRVVSNGAPPRSVPNNPHHERMSYTAKSDSPLFGTVVEAPQAAGPEHLENDGRAGIADQVSSAPIIDWSLDEDSSEPAVARSIPWGFASVLVTAATTLLAILLLRKRQVVTVVTSGTGTTDESA